MKLPAGNGPRIAIGAFVVAAAAASVRAQDTTAAWVAITADYQELFPAGVELFGHYWPASDGSIRIETGRALDRLDLVQQRAALRLTRSSMFRWRRPGRRQVLVVESIQHPTEN